MAAPTFVSYADSGSTWTTQTDDPTYSVSVTVQTGDLLIVFGGVESDAFSGTATVIATPAGGGLTYTQQIQPASGHTDGSHCQAHIWTATASSNATFNVTSSCTTPGATAVASGIGVYVFRDATFGTPNTAGNVNGGTAASQAITTAADNSALICFFGDWGAIDGASRTWRTVNSITPTSGNGLEKLYARNSLAWAVFSAYWNDAGTAGSKTVGVTAPTGQTPNIVVIEVQGTGSAPAPAPTVQMQIWPERMGPWPRPQTLSQDFAALSVQVEASTGEGQIGLSAEATTKKVARVSANSSLGLTGLATTKKVGKAVANSSLGLTALATAKKAAPATGNGSLGLSANFSHVQIANITCNASLGLTGIATTKKVSTPVSTGQVGLTGSVTAKHVGRPSANGHIGLTGLATAKKVSTPTANGHIGLSSQSTTKKVGKATGNASMGLWSRASLVVVDSRAITAFGCLGIVGLATAKKRSTPTATGDIGLLGRNTAVTKKSTGSTARGLIGLTGLATTKKKQALTARAFIGLSSNAVYFLVVLGDGNITGGRRTTADIGGGQRTAVNIYGGQRSSGELTGGPR